MESACFAEHPVAVNGNFSQDAFISAIPKWWQQKRCTQEIIVDA
jgi:hypothetical protein